MTSSGTFGRHVIAEIKNAPFDALNNPKLILDAMIEGAERSGATVLGHRNHIFEPQGFSATVLLSESHVSIHTFPERGYASFDAYTCGGLADPKNILDHVVERLGAKSVYWYTIHRGLDIEKSMRISSFSSHEIKENGDYTYAEDDFEYYGNRGNTKTDFRSEHGTDPA